MMDSIALSAAWVQTGLILLAVLDAAAIFYLLCQAGGGKRGAS